MAIKVTYEGRILFEETEDSGLGIIDLENKGITDITKIKGLDNLERNTTVRLLCNPGIVEIPKIPWHPSIKTLVLNYCSINNIAEQAFEDSEIETLYIEDNKLGKLPAFGGPKLQDIEASFNRISRIDPEASQSWGRELMSLNLWGNMLTSFDGLVLPKLTLLDLSYNRFIKMGNLSTYSDLQILRLRSNFIESVTTLPINIKAFEIMDNKVKYISDLVNSPNCRLFTLDLSGNRVKLGKGFYKMEVPNLQELNLANNHLTKLGIPVGMPNLLRLYLGNNPFKEPLPDFTEYCPKLNYIKLNKTGLSGYRVKGVYIEKE